MPGDYRGPQGSGHRPQGWSRDQAWALTSPEALGLSPGACIIAPMAAYALLAEVSDRPGMISDLTRVLADHHANITYVDIHDAGEIGRALV